MYFTRLQVSGNTELLWPSKGIKEVQLKRKRSARGKCLGPTGHQAHNVFACKRRRESASPHDVPSILTLVVLTSNKMRAPKRIPIDVFASVNAVTVAIRFHAFG
jgi:hypothetical protein